MIVLPSCWRRILWSLPSSWFSVWSFPGSSALTDVAGPAHPFTNKTRIVEISWLDLFKCLWPHTWSHKNSKRLCDGSFEMTSAWPVLLLFFCPCSHLLFQPFLFDCHCIVVVVVFGFTIRTDAYLVILAVNLNLKKKKRNLNNRPIFL